MRVHRCPFWAAAALIALIDTAHSQVRTGDTARVAIAFVNVNVIRMGAERVDAGQTVVVDGDRIAAIGAAADVRVPASATVIDGSGRYLVPGLTDAHVHLTIDMPWARARPDFGEAPLYLAHGVTTVINLRGTPMQLEWRRRINAGELLGPAIYTSGDFVNEPRVSTPEEVAQDIAAQHRAGYDLIKFHEIFTPGAGYVTAKGLSLASYRKMNEVAREMGMPLVGHAPVNLGLETLLQARQPLAHLGMLSNIYFMPLASNRTWLMITAAASTVLLALVIAIVAGAIARRWRATVPRPSRTVSRVRILASVNLSIVLFAVITAALFFPGGPFFDSLALRLAFTLSILAMTITTVKLVASAIEVSRDLALGGAARVHAALASSATVTFVCAALAFWLPIAWRSSDSGIERLARRIHDAGIPVQTTLVVYEALGGPSRLRLAKDPAIDYLLPDVRAAWRRQAEGGLSGYRYTDFMKKVAGALNRAGVPLMAGTDAMGLPLVAPGSSLHHELDLLVASGLTPYEAMRAATIVPAIFLGKEREFGTIETGKRADLLLVEGNPLEDVRRLRQPIGVMTRGRWLPREQLQQMLATLAQEH